MRTVLIEIYLILRLWLLLRDNLAYILKQCVKRKGIISYLTLE